jgi:hypothetical protein
LPEAQELKDMRAGIARASRRGRDPAEADQLRAEYAALKIEIFIRRVIAEAPPLTEGQRLRLSRLLTAPDRSAG